MKSSIRIYLSKICEKPLMVSFIFFIFLWFFVYYQFFFNYFSPGILNDTYDYFSVVDLWLNNEKFKIKDLPIDLPMGLPYLIFLFNFFDLGHFEFLVFQTISLYISFAFLISILIKHHKIYGLVAMFFSSVYLIDSETIFWSVSYATETFYTISLTVVCLIFYSFFIKPSNLKASLIAFSVCLPILFRSNGIYILFLVPLTLVILNFINQINYFRIILGRFLIFFIFFTVLSFCTTGYVNYGNWRRMLPIVENLIGSKQDQSTKKALQIQKNDKRLSNIQPSRFKLTLKYINPVSLGNSSFYSAKIQSLISKNHLEISNGLKMFDKKIPVSDRLKKLVKKDLLYKKQDIVYHDLINEINPSEYSPIWFKLHFKIYEIKNHVFKTTIWNLFCFGIFILSLLSLFIKSESGNSKWILFAIFAIHYISIFLLPLMHGSFQYRYSLVSEFIIWVFSPIAVKNLFELFLYKYYASK